MDPAAIALAIGAWFLLTRRGDAKKTPQSQRDVGEGATTEVGSGEGVQHHTGGSVPIGQYREGQRVIARLPLPFASFFGVGPTDQYERDISGPTGRQTAANTSYAIALPLQSGPNSTPYRTSSAKDGDGKPLTHRLRRSYPVSDEPRWLPLFPQTHRAYTAGGGNGGGDNGYTPDGAVRPSSQDWVTLAGPNVPPQRQRTIPGILVETADGAVPMILAEHTVNFSAWGLYPPMASFGSPNPYRLFIGARHWTAIKKGPLGFTHVPYGEVKKALAWIPPNGARNPSRSGGAFQMRANIPATRRIFTRGVYGDWVTGSRPGRIGQSYGTSVSYAYYVTAGRNQVTWSACPSLPGIVPCPRVWTFPGCPQLPANPYTCGQWPGPKYDTLNHIGAFFAATARGGVCFNAHANTASSYNRPATGSAGAMGAIHGERNIAATKVRLPYPPTAPLERLMLESKVYVQALRGPE